MIDILVMATDASHRILLPHPVSLYYCVLKEQWTNTGRLMRVPLHLQTAAG